MIRCPHRFSWRRNGKFFNILKDPRVTMRKRSGTLEIGFRSGGRPEDYEGEYQCFASNDFGVALSNKILLRVSSKNTQQHVITQYMAIMLLTTIANTRNTLYVTFIIFNEQWQFMRLCMYFVWWTKSYHPQPRLTQSVMYHLFSFFPPFLPPFLPLLLPSPIPILQRLLCGLKRCWSQWWWLKAPRWFYPATPHQACLLRSPSGWTAVSTSYTQICTQSIFLFFYM